VILASALAPRDDEIFALAQDYGGVSVGWDGEAELVRIVNADVAV
jgi:hypothetical protein